MEDTSRENRKLVYDIVMSKTEEERFLMCAEMYEEAKMFARIGMPNGLSDAEQERFVFERIQGAHPTEFTGDEMQR